MSQYRQFIQIPGPNPILRAEGGDAWDGRIIEACDCLKDNLTYYLYYHGVAANQALWPGGYQLGVATAPHTLGPFRKHPGPVLGVGAPGEWDDLHVACAFVLKRGASEYLMWYSGTSRAVCEGDPGWAPGQERWSIGLATADNPLGPWTKHPANPIVPRFGYVGGVVLKDGRFHLYTETPIGSRGPDYAPLALATADRPEGPYTEYHDNPVLKPGEWGEWDDGGLSEAEVSLNGDRFHCFYGGAKLHPTRIESQESIGYAWSDDGVTFHKFPGNPVALRERNPDATAFAEVHHLIEPPFVYCYHTLRYASRPGDEDLGVQVLATQRPFCLTMPVLQAERLEPGEEIPLAQCPPISLEHVRSAALNVACAGSEEVHIEVYGSADGLQYNTSRHEGFSVVAGRHTMPLTTPHAFVKLAVTNADAAQAASDLSISVTLKG